MGKDKHTKGKELTTKDSDVNENEDGGSSSSTGAQGGAGGRKRFVDWNTWSEVDDEMRFALKEQGQSAHRYNVTEVGEVLESGQEHKLGDDYEVYVGPDGKPILKRKHKDSSEKDYANRTTNAWKRGPGR